MGTSSHCVFSNTIQSAISAKLGLPHETDARHHTVTFRSGRLLKRRYQRQVRQGRRDRYAGLVRAVWGRARSQAKALDEAAKMLDEAASLIEQTIRVKKDRSDVRCREIEIFS